MSSTGTTVPGHGFLCYHTPMYRPGAAMDGWAKVFSFFGRQLSS